MIDEIQQVLEAQARATAEVEAARERNAAQLAASGTRTRAIREHNAQRALHAIRRFENACAQEVERASAELEAQAARAERDFRATVAERLDGLVQRALARFWPD